MTALAIAARLLDLLALVQLAGVFVFAVAVAGPAFATLGPHGVEAAVAFDRRLMRLGGWALGAALVTGVLGFGVQAVRVIDPPSAAASLDALGALLTGTHYGLVWTLRMLALGLLGAWLMIREPAPSRADWYAVRLEAAGLAGLALAAHALGGHAITVEGWGWWPVLIDGVHRFAVASWLGGLLPLALLLDRLERTRGDEAPRVGRHAVSRFSMLGMVSVATLVVTGAGSAWAQAQAVPPLVGTPYGQTLQLKLVVAIGLLGVAALNLIRLKPRILAGATPVDLRRLRRTVLIEAGLGAGVLLFASVLAVTPPARHGVVSWPFTFRLAWDATLGLPGVSVRVAVGSLVTGLGLVVVLAVLLQRRYWPLAAAGAAALGIGLWIALPPLAVDAYPTTYVRPAVTYTTASVGRGLTLYHAHCAACHGDAGYGDGPVAATLRPRPADLTARHANDHTAGDMFWWLTAGIRGSSMPGFAEQLSEEQRWEVINAVRALAAAERARGFEGLFFPDARIAAPDFDFLMADGRSGSLREFRGRAAVLLVIFGGPDSRARLDTLADGYATLRRIGAEVLAIPAGPDAGGVGHRLVSVPLVTDGASETAATYQLFGQHPRAGAPPGYDPRHIEILIDRQGYIRGRWTGGTHSGSHPISHLVDMVQQLGREPPVGAPPDDHVH